MNIEEQSDGVEFFSTLRNVGPYEPFIVLDAFFTLWKLIPNLLYVYEHPWIDGLNVYYNKYDAIA